MSPNVDDDVSVTCHSSKWCLKPVGYCYYKSHCPLGFLGSTEPDCRLLNVSGSHVYCVSPITHRLHHVLPQSLFYFLSHISFRHAHTLFPPCRKMDGMFPNHRCCSTCESFTFFTTQSGPARYCSYFLTVLPGGDYCGTSALWDNEQHGILLM